MTRAEFLQLLSLGAKRIDQDIRFEVAAANHPTRELVGPVEVFNTGGRKILLKGHYNDLYDSVSFTFICPEAGGPICRVDVRGTAHRGSRTHKHDLQTDSDPSNNLPHAVDRPDLVASSPTQIWHDLCARAQIQHTGQFVDPRPGQLTMVP